MAQMIFVNLPVSDLARSTAFYTALGGTLNPAFSNEQASSIVLSDVIHVMLLRHDFYQTFTTKQIPDAHQSAQVLLCLSSESREAVDAQVDAAVEAGGTGDPCPKQDFGVMYGRSYEDPDGHIWEVMWMDPAAAAQGADAIEAGMAAEDA